MKKLAQIVGAIVIFPLLMATTYALVIFSYLLVPFIIAIFVLAFIFTALGGLDHMD